MSTELLPSENVSILTKVVAPLYQKNHRMVDTAEREYIDALFEYALTDFTTEDLRVFEADHPKLAAAVKREADKHGVEYEKSVMRLVGAFYDNGYQIILDAREE